MDKVIVGAAAAAAAGMLALALSGPEPATTQISVPTTVCVEDMQCWDCETMGNGICGVTPAGEEVP